MQIMQNVIPIGLLFISSVALGWETKSGSSSSDPPAASSKQDSDSKNASETSAEESTSDEEPDSQETLAGHSFHGEVFNEGPRQAAYLMEGTGVINFPVASKVPEVQEFINQGVGQLHGFWFFEAERSFRQAAALDPDCAAAYWGMAMANANNRDRAKKLIQKAVDRKYLATDRVCRYITALSTYLNTKKGKSATEAYVKALEKIVYDYSDDLDAQAFIAVELWKGRRDGIKITSHLAVDGLIQQVLDVEPMHPVHHYRIHLWDAEKASRALGSSALCGQSAPAIAHMWHMPGHIYAKLKRYSDAAWQQEASARTDHAQMMRDQLLPDQIHNFAHNNEWLIRDLIHIGRIHDAVDLAKNMTELPRHPKYNLVSKGGSSAAYGRTRLFQVLQAAELWSDAISLADSPYLEPTDSFSEQIKQLRLLGRAYFRSGDFANGAMIVAELETQLCEKFASREQKVSDAEAKAKQESKDKKATEKMVKAARRSVDLEIRKVERSLQEMYGHLAVQSEANELAIEMFDKAGEVDRWYLAFLQLQAGKTDEAIKRVADYAKSHPGECLPLAHKAHILWQAGKQDEAMEAMKELQENGAEIDLDIPGFQRLKPIATAMEWSEDWRPELKRADDLGDRPELDTLGPFRWQPNAAPAWSLQSDHGETVSLSDYRGKPIVLIFYLGYGCLHCAEQLQAFGPERQRFIDAGIELLAVSSDDQPGLQKSRENYTDGNIPFSLLANPTLDVFKQYRAYDDFEDQPLHGTFVIDGKGRIRWHDISYEPFMDHEFVLKEAKRLLAQDAKDSSPPLVKVAR
ncbi:MAG: peroxiredoxin family protein [Pirellulaceae bacterium]|nr:peroxiredoxin family protein [Pirellulaceae bacterium]